MPARVPFAILAVLAAFAGGVVSSHLFERNAYGQTAPFASTVYVPSDGLAFRTFEGHVIAKLSYDSHGGVFDLYDSHERPSTTFRAGSSPLVRPTVSEVIVPTGPRALDLGY
jgi:hypothetical protein